MRRGQTVLVFVAVAVLVRLGHCYSSLTDHPTMHTQWAQVSYTHAVNLPSVGRESVRFPVQRGVNYQVEEEHWEEEQEEPCVDPPDTRDTFAFTSFGTKAAEERNDHTTWEDPALIPLGDMQPNEEQRAHAYRYVFDALRLTQAKFLLYPYSFDHQPTDGTSSPVHFESGALVATTQPDDLPETGSEAFFRYLADVDSVDLGKAKALYDVHVAVLRIFAEVNGRERDLTYESDTFCTAVKTFLGKISSCFNKDDFLTWASANPGRAGIAYLNEEDIQSGILMKGDDLRFGILVLPDTILHSEQQILDLLGETGRTAIVDFVQAGGVVYASAKASQLLELLGLLEPGTVRTDALLGATGHVVQVEDCAATPPANDEFAQKSLCFALPKGDLDNPPNYLLNAWMWDPSQDAGLQVVAWFTASQNMFKRDPTTGITSSLSLSEALQPALLYKVVGKGQLIISNAQPTMAPVTRYYPWFYNALFLACSKQVIFDTTIVGEPIPGLEADITLNLLTDLWNVYSSDMNDIALDVSVPTGLEVVSHPPGCSVTSAEGTYPVRVNCVHSQLAAFSHTTFSFELKIVDAMFTKNQKNVLLVVLDLAYEQTYPPWRREIHIGGVYVDALLAALIRGEVNPDPSSFYPLPGRGAYIDNVLPAENKENTDGVDVFHTAIVPIVSPLVDISNQAALVHALEFYDRYYKAEENGVADYPYPLRTTEDFDYLDYKFLTTKASVLCADWDTPVKTFKVDRSSIEPPPPDVPDATDIGDVEGAQMGTNIDNLGIVLKQRDFREADSYFEHAQQRQLVFVETTDPAGAAAKYGGSENIPPERLNPRLLPTKAEKEQILFARADIYFYSVYNYPLPLGIDDPNSVITIDRYPYDYAGNCVSGAGNARAKVKVEGYFDDTMPGGLKPNEYSNELFMDCARKRIPYEEVETLTQDKVKRTHYLFPVSNADPATYMHFDETTGELDTYPEVKMIQAHSTPLLIHPNITRKGARMDLSFPKGTEFASDPSTGDCITFSADQVAFTRVEYVAETVSAGPMIRAFFKRGQFGNEAYGKPSEILVNIECLHSSQPDSVAATLTLFELSYSFAEPSTEHFEWVATTPLEFTRQGFLSLPAVRLQFRLTRDPPRYNSTSYVQPYEWLEPFVRYGVYFQELAQHATVWGSAEVHPVSDPGLVGRSGGFSVISHVGTHSIPFREYVTTGEAQVIPSAPETGRIDWNDIWGRPWAQPVRSVFVDIPPIPPPLRNFMMTTTFELLDPGTGERRLQWPSDQEMDVHVHVKLLNNYPKYFEITTCTDNRLMSDDRGPSRVFSSGYDPDDPVWDVDPSDTNQMISLSFLAKYGACYVAPPGGTPSEYWVGGESLTRAIMDDIVEASFCADVETGCPDMDVSSLPTVSRRPTSDDGEGLWNYSPEVEDFYPNNYIKPNMRDLTHYDYDDTKFDKAYKYHMDNNLPNVDKSIIKPHNVVALPIFKGFGYDLFYNMDNSNARFPYKGWWSDNLQNKDHTLVAGQAQANDVAVDKEDMVDGWVNLRDLTDQETLVSSKLGNIYVCLFNQHRARVDPQGTRNTYPHNVYQNNVVPILPDLEIDDWRLTSYNCDPSLYQYSPQNISMVDNLLQTNSARDWLYFASNLRGNAKETLNAMIKLQPISGVRYEGIAKVWDGGRFVYWNPANGPNSFLVVDNPVNVVDARRAELRVYQEVFPDVVPTFDAEIYQVIRILDPDEYGRTFDLPIYLNHYGFGDAAVSVYVGAEGTSALLLPGRDVIAKVDFFNNAGFDWNLQGEAIEAEELGEAPLSASDLLYRVKHAILAPLKYNFLSVHIPQELSAYLSVAPSRHTAGIAPLFFDFMNVNVASIRDGFRGTYYYNFSLAADIPSTLTGRLYEIPITINPEYFDHLPGYNDPTREGFHDYTLSIPPIQIGIPFLDDYPVSSWRGKVFYTSSRASNIELHQSLPDNIVPVSAKVISTADLLDLRSISSTTNETTTENLHNFYESLGPDVDLQVTAGAGGQEATYNLASVLPQLPIPRDQGPDTTSYYILMKAEAPSLPFGENVVSEDLSVEFQDHVPKTKSSRLGKPRTRTIVAKGAWLDVGYSAKLVSHRTLNELHDQHVRLGASATARLVLTADNIGSSVAYNTNFTVHLAPEIKPVVELLGRESAPGVTYTITKDVESGNYSVGVELKDDLVPGTPTSTILFIRYVPQSTTRAQADSATYLKMVDGMSATMFLGETLGNKRVTQTLMESYSVPVVEDPAPVIVLNGEITDEFDISLSARVEHVPGDVTTVWFKFLRRATSGQDAWEVISFGESNTTVDSLLRKFNSTQRMKDPDFAWEIVAQIHGLVLNPQLRQPSDGVNPSDLAVLAESDPLNFSNSPSGGGSALAAILGGVGGALGALLLLALLLLLWRRKRHSKASTGHVQMVSWDSLTAGFTKRREKKKRRKAELAEAEESKKLDVTFLKHNVVMNIVEDPELEDENSAELELAADMIRPTPKAAPPRPGRKEPNAPTTPSVRQDPEPMKDFALGKGTQQDDTLDFRVREFFTGSRYRTKPQRLSSGLYSIGPHQVLIKIMNDTLMVRTEKGYVSLQRFMDAFESGMASSAQPPQTFHISKGGK